MSELNTIRADFDDELNPSITVPFPKSMIIAGCLFLVFAPLIFFVSVGTFVMQFDSTDDAVKKTALCFVHVIGIVMSVTYFISGLLFIRRVPLWPSIPILTAFLPLLMLLLLFGYLFVTRNKAIVTIPLTGYLILGIIAIVPAIPGIYACFGLRKYHQWLKHEKRNQLEHNQIEAREDQ